MAGHDQGGTPVPFERLGHVSGGGRRPEEVRAHTAKTKDSSEHMSGGGVEVAFGAGGNNRDAPGRCRHLTGEGLEGGFRRAADQVLGSHTELVLLPTLADLVERPRQQVGDDGLCGHTGVEAGGHQRDGLNVVTARGMGDEGPHQGG